MLSKSRRPGLLLLIGLLFTFGCGDCLETASLTETNDQNPDAAISNDSEGTGDGESDANPGGNGDTDTDTDPECSAEAICGTACCSGEELCLNNTCTLPGDSCTHSLECGDDEYCETTIERCLPNTAGACIYQPDDDSFDPVVEYAWAADANTPMPTHDQVMMAPAVVDITGDGIPEIVFSTFQGNNYTSDSVLRAVNGRTYEPVFDLIDPTARVSGSASVSIGDIDGDGKNEIVAVPTGGQGLIVFDDHTTDWAIKWTTDNFPMSWDGAYLADLDANGSVEIVANNRIYDGATGDVLCQNNDVSSTPRNSLTADLNGDGNLEIVAATGAFRFVRNGDGTVDCPTLFNYEGGTGGFPAVADFGTFNGDDHDFGAFDGFPEIAVVTGTTVILHNGQTGEVIWSTSMPAAGHPHFSTAECTNSTGAGPPTIADFNGDGRPNIATAGACFYVVFDDTGELMWSSATQDFSSRVTGSSVFDFQGNGPAEVVYADECFLRVYDGAGNGDGTTDILFEIANTSGTTREMPIIVDVDADFHADIVLIGNDYSGGLVNNCTSRWPGFVESGGASRGIRVIRDAENRWVSTRPVWNQHAYSVTNVCDGVDDTLCVGVDNHPGAIPSGRLDNWNIDYLNNYRQNSQGEGLFHAPDLVITNLVGLCDMDGFTLEVTVANQGSRAVIEGLDVALFAEVDGTEELITVLQTTELLAPGASETLTYVWDEAPFSAGSGDEVDLVARANDDGTGQRQYRECDEENNERITTAICSCTTDDDCENTHYCADNGMCIPRPG